MKNKYVIFILLIFSIIIGIGIYFYNQSPKDTNSYEATRTAINNTSFENNTTANENTNELKTENTTPETQITSPPKENKEPIETEISSYTSKIRQQKDSDRQKNITLACSSLNDTIVENGKTFSFCGTVGKTSQKKGYKKAKVFQDGKEVEATGGGLCQVSSTLYNAVLKSPNLKVVERHSHSKEVYYVPKGKDAAVAYGSYDFKFKNNTGNSIKIKASNTKNNVTIKLLKIE